MRATDDGFHLEGYEPDEKARKKRKQVKRPEVEDQLKINVKPPVGERLYYFLSQS